MSDPLTIAQADPCALALVETWEDAADLIGALPSACRAADFGDGRVLWWEPGVWLVRAGLGSFDTLRDTLETALRGRGAVTDVSGGFRRILLRGSACRELLMFGAVFDAEHGLAPGAVAGTMIHHVPVRLDAIDETSIDVYVPPSYADELLHHWRAASARMTRRAG